jgi:hypothetical protein
MPIKFRQDTVLSSIIKPYVVGEEGETDEAAFNSACDAL